MGRNIEIKARIESDQFELLRTRVVEIATSGPVELNQTDTFFHCNNGRLKLREFGDGTAELIFYQRPDQAGPKTSDYVLSKCDPKTMLPALSGSNGVVGGVKKQRELFFIEQTRVHLDSVENLGTFLELEVVLESEQTEATGETIANEILKKLNVPESSFISLAYIDLLLANQSKQTP